MLDIFSQVQLDIAKCYSLAPACASTFLYDFELEGALLQHAILVYRKPDGQCDVVVVEDFVVADLAALGAATVLGSGRV